MASKSMQTKPQPKASPNPSQIIAQHQQWSGPLPPPGALAQFNDIIPDGAQRIMKMVESEQEHRIKSEELILQATIKDTKRGSFIGGGLALCAISGAIYTAVIGAHPSVSIALVSLPVLTIVTVLIRNKSSDKSDQK